MDLRDIIRSSPETVVGHKVVYDSLNYRNEIKRFSKDPLKGLIGFIDDTAAEYTKGDIGRYLQAYSWYTLCLHRVLTHISLSRRAERELRYHPRNLKYSSHNKQLAAKYNEFNPYIELDYQNLIIHSCILLDRVISLSRRFIVGGNLPSFTSFNKHKRFIKKNPNILGIDYIEYVQYIREKTEWFDIPVKVLRDKFLMHSSEKHISFIGWSDSNWDLVMLNVKGVKSALDSFNKRC